jgi:glycosyltransferase involved in cell wall biosynthesis
MADSSPRRKVLLLCNDVIGENMAGSGIRYWEFARVLSQWGAVGSVPGFDVTLAVMPFLPEPLLPAEMPFPVRVVHCANGAEVRELARQTDVMVTQGILLSTYPFLAELGVPLALDYYIPFLLERLHVDTEGSDAEHLFRHEGYRRALQHQLVAADFIVCASEKQRDYYLGALSAAGRVNPFTHDEDATLRRLIDVVPIGLANSPPVHTKQVLKGVRPGFAADDKVLLWLSGIWNWFDAPTLLRAMARVVERRNDVKLFFMGIRHPSPRAPQMQATEEAIRLCKELGLYERFVFFEDWVPYHERANYLLEADVGVSFHRDHLETRFSFRGRFLDYLWASLPVIATEGDVLSDLVSAQSLGRVVKPGDDGAVADAILDMVSVPDLRAQYAQRFERVAAAYRWEVVMRPLIGFCADPRIAPDKAYLRDAAVFRVDPTPWWRLPAKALGALRRDGVQELRRQTGQYVRWLRHRHGA